MGRGLYPLLSLVGGLVEVLVQLVQIKIHFTLSPLPPYLSSGRLVQGGLIAQRPGGAQVPHARLPLHPVDEHQEEGFVREPVERGGQQAVKCYGVCAAGIVTDGVGDEADHRIHIREEYCPLCREISNGFSIVIGIKANPETACIFGHLGGRCSIYQVNTTISCVFRIIETNIVIRQVGKCDIDRKCNRRTTLYGQISADAHSIIIAHKDDGISIIFVLIFIGWQKKIQRHVNAGEQGIKIFAPAPVKVQVEGDTGWRSGLLSDGT